MTMVERLKKAQTAFNSMVIVGLDFDIDKIPAWFAEKYKASMIACIFEFNKAIINAVAPFVCGFKPNLAFYEIHGCHGWEALEKTVGYIRDKYPDHFIILDGKRGDIGNTATKYALTLKNLGADAVTVNPYLGPKTLQPFLDEGLGIIALCVTSNKDAAIFQNAEVITPSGSQPFYQLVAKTLKEKYEQTENLGLVAGATHPEELGEIRQLVGDDVVLLIPGIGKQDGDLEATIRNNGNGLGVVNTSRAVLYASSGEDFAEAAATEAKRTRDDINAIKEKMKGDSNNAINT